MAWRLDIPVPQQLKQTEQQQASRAASIVVLRTATGERYRWIRAEEGAELTMELSEEAQQQQQTVAMAQGLAGWALSFDLSAALERVGQSKRPEQPHPVFGGDMRSCVTSSTTVLEGYKVRHVYVWSANYSEEQSKEMQFLIEASKEASKSQAQDDNPDASAASAEAAAKVLQLAFSSCAPSTQLSAIVQEVDGAAFGAHSHVTLVFSRNVEESSVDPKFFMPPAHLLKDPLPFPVGVQLLKVAAAQVGTAVPEPTNPTRKKHSTSALF